VLLEVAVMSVESMVQACLECDDKVGAGRPRQTLHVFDSILVVVSDPYVHGVQAIARKPESDCLNSQPPRSDPSCHRMQHAEEQRAVHHHFLKIQICE